MRKLVVVLCFVLLTSCALLQREERFVNPIFYEKLLGDGYIRLTPMKYYVENRYGYHTSAKCEMLENLEDRITLKCLFMPADSDNEEELIIVGSDDTPKIWIKSYVVSPNPECGGYVIEEQSCYNGDKRYLTHNYYYVNPDKKL